MDELKYIMDDIVDEMKNDKNWSVPEEERFLVDFIDTFLLVL